MPDSTEDLLTTDQAANMLGVTRQGVIWLIKNKGLKAEFVGGKYWILRRGDVEEYKRQRETHDNLTNS